MHISDRYFEEVFDFGGLWDVPSRCGLRRLMKNGIPVVIVTELYQDNPGSSVTSVAARLATQLATSFGYDMNKLIYIECNPDMKSKLSFYDEEFFQVLFDIEDGIYVNPVWRKIPAGELLELLAE